MTDSMRDPPQRPKGHQPYFFDDPAIDQLHSALLALTSELAVAFDRIDTLERLLERDTKVSRAAIDAFVPDVAASEQRAARRTDLINRVLRPFIQYRADLIERARHTHQESDA